DKISSDVARIDEDLINRMIPEVYNEEMYHYLEDNFSFTEYMLVLYRTDISNKEVIEMLDNYDKINYLGISTAREDRFALIITIKFKRIDVEVYVHTINSKTKAFLYEVIGVDGIFSDWIYQQ
ncbi:MAG: hypothetical protein QM489_03830, partial [Candidatus Izemoplasma sp.]